MSMVMIEELGRFENCFQLVVVVVVVAQCVVVVEDNYGVLHSWLQNNNICHLLFPIPNTH
jgi:hypothetical protein